MSPGNSPRVACIGAGHWGRNIVRNFSELGALAAIGETDAARRAELATQYPGVALLDSPEAAFGDPSIQAVAIATPAETHARLVRRALEAGKDVFVEKPLALSADEGRELVRLAQERGRILMVGHLLWYHPAVLKLKELVQTGQLGRIRYIYSNRLNLGKIRREENILWSFAPHDISVILGLLEEMPESVEARGGNYLHDRIADVTVSLLSFASGVRAHVFVSWLHPFKEQKLVVVGDRQMAVFDDIAKDDKLVLYPHSIEWQGQVPVANRAEGKAVALEQGEPLRAECAHFLECVVTRRTPRTDGAEAVRVLGVLQACEASLDGAGGNGTKPSGGSSAAAAGASAAGRPADAAPAPGPQAQKSFRAHESAYIDEGVEIGDGTTIWHFSHVLRGSRVGRDCRIGQNVVIGPAVTVGDSVKIQNNVSVYEGVTLEDHVFCGPSMVFTNVLNPRSEIPRMHEIRSTLVRTGATLGANCTIVCGTTIGRYAFVGAGAVVTKDVPDHALIVGNPGRIIGWMCRCGERIDFNDGGANGACRVCGRTYEREGEVVSAL